ncbi:Holliday junction resolvase [Candidatus Woesearchaeota archaeon]|nr:Holliday junction resolvase [Candidatus Woesearchaeota archaeon]
MSLKSKGINAERELIQMFWSNGWASTRVAGSGNSQYPSPDVIASNAKRNLAIEAKVTKDRYKHFPADEIAQLKEFSGKFGAEPWIAIKFNRKGWFFLNLENLQPTGAHYSISLKLAQNKGLAFSDLIKDK